MIKRPVTALARQPGWNRSPALPATEHKTGGKGNNSKGTWESTGEEPTAGLRLPHKTLNNRASLPLLCTFGF